MTVLLSNITIKANSKVVKERIVTRIIASPARLSYTLCDQSLRPVARGTYDYRTKEHAHRVPPARRRRWSADTLETSCRCDVKECSGGDRSAQTVQMIQTMSSETPDKVQNKTMPDLEPTTEELERKGARKLHTQHSADGAPQNHSSCSSSNRMTAQKAKTEFRIQPRPHPADGAQHNSKRGSLPRA